MISLKPLCRYGSDCYRRNPQHLAEFDHPKKMEGASAPKRPKLATEQSSSESASNAAPKTPSPKKSAATNVKPTATANSSWLEDLHLSRVDGLPRAANADCLSMGDILRLHPASELISSVHFTYMCDLGWLREEYPRERREAPMLVVCGREMAATVMEMAVALDMPKVRVAIARLEDRFGTHHTKMSLLRFPDGVRIAIHTANLVPQDWGAKTQGIFLTKLLLPTELAEAESDSATHFRADLVRYLQAYRLKQLDSLVDQLRRHDFRSVQAQLIASVPGRHNGPELHQWGHMGLRAKLARLPPIERSCPLIAQFSSIGSLGAVAEAWLKGEWLTSLGASSRPASLGPPTPLRLVYPCVDDVRNSLEGYAAGGSLPYQSGTAARQPWLRGLLHRWKADRSSRSRASPHIKTYWRVSPGGDAVSWVLLTSANLSKAAWGALEKAKSQLHIRSYELGVLVTEGGPPSPLWPPFDVPLSAYAAGEESWLVDKRYPDPDILGNTWPQTNS